MVFRGGSDGFLRVAVMILKPSLPSWLDLEPGLVCEGWALLFHGFTFVSQFVMGWALQMTMVCFPSLD